MAQQSYAFELPRWRTPHKLNSLTAGLLALSLIWLGCYGLLGVRLWRGGVSLGNPANQLLILVSIALGVATVAGWTVLLPQWRARWQGRAGKAEWPALSVDEIQALSPSDFEAYTAYRLFKRQGYAVLNTPDVKDGGIDILVTDPLGREAVVQCKRYRNTVGVSTVRDLYGTMINAGAERGMLVASGRISRDSYEWAADKPIVLIDGDRLAELSRAEPNSAYLFHLHQRAQLMAESAQSAPKFVEPYE